MDLTQSRGAKAPKVHLTLGACCLAEGEVHKDPGWMSLSFQLGFRHNLPLGEVQKGDHRALVEEAPHQAYVGVLERVHESFQ